MDLAKYPESKASETCKLVPLYNGVVQLVIRQFDKDTAKEIAPLVFNYDDEGIGKQIAKVDDAIAELNKSKAGMQALRDDIAAINK